MTRDEVLALLERRRDAVARRDERALAALYGETVRLESPLAGRVVGREAAVKATWAFFEGFSDATVDEDLFAIDDDRVALVAHLAGTHTGEIMGLPPSGTYFAKELLLQAAAEKGQWWWTIVLQAAGIFTGAYVLRVLAHALLITNEAATSYSVAPHIRELAALALALCSLLLGLVPWRIYLPIPNGFSSDPFSLGSLSKALLVILGGAVVAIWLGRWERPSGHLSRWKAVMVVVGRIHRTGLAWSMLVERCDNVLRQWPTACLSLLTLSALLGASILLTF